MVQVKKEHYRFETYDSKGRWNSYWYQISEVLAKKPKTVLEVGMGNSTVRDYLKKVGISVYTVDIDPELKPNLVADVTDMRKIKSGSFDIVLCCEVLEHIPFHKFQTALREIHRVAERGVVLSLPHWGLNFSLGFYLPVIGKAQFLYKFPFIKTHTFNGEHYWEIGKRGYPLRKIKREIRKAGFEIERTFCVFENPYHRVFVLRK